MCEFTVSLKEGGQEKVVAKDIVRATYVGGRLVLIDVLGTKRSLENVIISEIDVGSEKLRLVRPNALTDVIGFVEE